MSDTPLCFCSPSSRLIVWKPAWLESRAGQRMTQGPLLLRITGLRSLRACVHLTNAMLQRFSQDETACSLFLICNIHSTQRTQAFKSFAACLLTKKQLGLLCGSLRLITLRGEKPCERQTISSHKHSQCEQLGFITRSFPEKHSSSPDCIQIQNAVMLAMLMCNNDVF